MQIITLAKTKELLGITDNSLDTEISRYIPIVDSKVKLITKNRYNTQVYGKTVFGVTVVELYSIQNRQYGFWNFRKNRTIDFNECRPGINNPWCIDDLADYLEIGTMATGEGIAADTYIEDVYYNGASVTIGGTDYSVPAVVLSNAATADSDNAQIFLGFNIGLQTTVAKGISWLISQENRTIADAGIASKSIGTVRIQYAGRDAEIDGRYGMPRWFVKAFPVYMGGH